MLSEDGERFLPWMADPVINYEHLHRYRAACDLAVGCRVLDLASGEGYGSAMLARSGAAVVGLELDPLAVAHAVRAYGKTRARFVRGSITQAPFRSGQFDLVVCFEALEHVAEQEELCREAARVLGPDGCFLVSTPNRAVYTEAAAFHNPFHVRELDLGEFQELLGRHFLNVEVFGQHVYPVSSIFPLGREAERIREYVAERAGGAERYEFVGPERKEPRYFLGIGSNAELPSAVRSGSFLVDASEHLFALQRRSEGAVIELTRHLGVREGQVRDLEQRLGQAQEALGQEINARRTAADLAGELQRHLDARAAQARELDAMLEQRGRDLNELGHAIQRMEATLAWRLHRKARAVREALKRIAGRRG